MLNTHLSCFHGSGNEDISNFGIMVTLFPGSQEERVVRMLRETMACTFCCLHTVDWETFAAKNFSPVA